MTEEEKNEYFKKLAERFVKDIQENPRKLDSKIFNEIEKLERRKPILLIGKDKELIRNAVIEIHFTHPKVHRSATRTQSILARCSGNPYSPAISSVNKGEIILTEYSCIGKTETKIEDDLFSSNYSFIFEYRNGEMLFVRRLNSKRILERLADLDKGFNYGVLIINVPSMNIVPEELLGQFEIIELEPEKQDIPASTPKDTAKVQGRLIPLPVPSGTQWNEVSISFLDNENVSIKIKSKTIKKHYVEIGFKDERKSRPVPVKSWEFLKCLARLNGRFNSYQNTKKNDIEKSISELKKILVEIFKIEGNPIPYKKRGCSGVESKTDNPKKKRQDRAGYVTAFRIEDKSHSREYEESVINHNRKYVPPPKKHCNYKDENAGYNPDNYDRDNLEDE